MPQNKNTLNNNNKQANRQGENGNVFLFIMLGVILFAALSFTIARGFRSDNSSAMSDRQAELQATEIIEYAQRMERAINKIRRNGCSENNISFTGAPTHFGVDAYAHTPQVDPKCRAFDPEGGNMPILNTVQAGYHTTDTSAWPLTQFFYHRAMRIREIGVDEKTDLIMNLANIDRKVCLSINKLSGVENPLGEPPRDTSGPNGGAFTGTFGFDNTINSGVSVNTTGNEVNGRNPVCVVSDNGTVGNDKYYFYYALIER
ncbi:MAG: hypothetical protein AB8B83_03225 [Bdellovibrionales bacterium]